MHSLIPEKAEKLLDLAFKVLLLFEGFLTLKARFGACLAVLNSMKMLYYVDVRKPWRGLPTCEILGT